MKKILLFVFVVPFMVHAQTTTPEKTSFNSDSAKNASIVKYYTKVIEQ
ncbi:hypothetical protein [uncultured Mucilaginibacter sp.]|nr:hypothetical protein [uncultured Mucilaginibacter sp.]